MKMIAAALLVLLLAACTSVCKCPDYCGCDCPAHGKPTSAEPAKK